MEAKQLGSNLRVSKKLGKEGNGWVGTQGSKLHLVRLGTEIGKFDR